MLDDVDPSLSLSSSASLSTYVCLQDPLDTIILFSPLYVPIPSQPGLPYLIRDTRYSKDATDVIITIQLTIPNSPRHYLLTAMELAAVGGLEERLEDWRQ